MCNPLFMLINDDIFNVSKIQSVRREDQKNCLGKDSGVYILHIYMENDIGSQHKAYSYKKLRDEDFMKASSQLSKYSITKSIRSMEMEKNGGERDG